MAPTDKVSGVKDTVNGAQDSAGEVAAVGDSAKNDVAGGRKTTQKTGDDEVAPAGEKPSSLKIHIKLDLDVELHLSARIKGDITIGLL